MAPLEQKIHFSLDMEHGIQKNFRHFAEIFGSARKIEAHAIKNIEFVELKLSKKSNIAVKSINLSLKVIMYKT